ASIIGLIIGHNVLSTVVITVLIPLNTVFTTVPKDLNIGAATANILRNACVSIGPSCCQNLLNVDAISPPNCAMAWPIDVITDITPDYNALKPVTTADNAPFTIFLNVSDFL